MTFGEFAIGLSVGVGAVAIWLAAQFYKWSSDRSIEIKAAVGQFDVALQAAVEKIASAVQKLEVVMDRQLGPLSESARETTSLLWDRAFPQGTQSDSGLSEAQKAADEKSAEIEEKYTTVLKQLQDASAEASDIRKTVSQLMSESRRVDDEAREESIAENIIHALKVAGGRLKAGAVTNLVMEIYQERQNPTLRLKAIIQSLEELRAAGRVAYTAPMGPNTSVSLVDTAPQAEDADATPST